MTDIYRSSYCILCVFFICISANDKSTFDDCFCKLYGAVDDCSCKVENVESFNNLKIYPRLNSLLQKDFFRYWKVNLHRQCPFWADDSRCALKDCAVNNCDVNKLPEGLRKNTSGDKSKTPPSGPQHSQAEQCTDDERDDLGYLNKTLSESSIDAFKDWSRHDDQTDNFCEFDDDNSAEAQYVDLTLNPERFTGYKGVSAHRVWRAIYEENCFKPDHRDYMRFLQRGTGMCLEKRTFYRMVSGLHTSINVHLTADYFFPPVAALDTGRWGRNLKEFRHRFDPKVTDGAGPQRLKNLYFTYLVELRALAKAAPYLRNELYYTGNTEADREVRAAVEDLMNIVSTFPEHFDESRLFQGEEALNLKTAFKSHFRNISKIMDCVGCDKCKLWGKLQVTGMGTALKILFADSLAASHTPAGVSPSFQLRRGEIVALFNAFGRLSKSIREVEEFRRLLHR